METNVKVFNINGNLKKEVSVSEEELITIYIDGFRFISIFALPKDIEELAVGFLLTEGLTDYENIKKIEIRKNSARVELKKSENLKLLLELRSSGCSGIIQKGPKPVQSTATFDSKTILDSLKNLDNPSLEFKRTGGTHTACLISPEGEVLKVFDDVGRHNALDKVVGWSFLENVELEDKFLLFSGRLSTGIVNKAVRVGIPMIVSKAAPLAGGISSGEKLNLTLVGFARYPEFNAYTHEWRVR